ncbi:MAG: UDP-N-acetylmuramoyl-L-alanine--D-glutamate ligase [Acutalibacteraceae bacterium]|nr:UDP-N-acetylmuramoyl-L-alanine--D-glutamate ligase [Acutalibacteraceae bacterium]HCA54224.1 UDP-N-acetylmuramoyl-L-alanine--D-glutamate ligase [Oscillospiraceae bacterium]
MENNCKRFLEGLKGKTIALCGIGGSNLPLIRLFGKYGARMLACDKREREALGENAVLAEEAGAELHLGETYLKDLHADILFRTPGMRYYMDELTAARESGTAVTSEMEVFFDLCPCKTIAVTGSDGKTTTTTIIAEMLKAQGYTVHLGGNIGRPLLPDIEQIQPEDIAVVELSSFQLISMRRSPDIAVVTNLAPNHLDIHKDMQEYIDAKKNIVLHQNAFGKAVLNLDNDIANSFKAETRGQVGQFSRQQKVHNGAYLSEDGQIIMSDYGKETVIMAAKDIKIPGVHNIENYLAAITAVWGLVSIETIRQVATTFNGVEHRAELVRELDGVKYYNDAIGTSPTRTIKGTLSLYDRKIILIAGGYDKHLSYDEMGAVVPDKVKVLILFGATADKIEAATKAAPAYHDGNPLILRVQNMEEAVQAARSHAVSGDIVSMSPASASFDMYKNFAEKGLHFKRLVNEL